MVKSNQAGWCLSEVIRGIIVDRLISYAWILMGSAHIASFD